jgi:hypothetical protein
MTNGECQRKPEARNRKGLEISLPGRNYSEFEIPSILGLGALSFFRHLALTCLALAPLALHAASNSLAGNDTLRLRPPRGEIPPGFWEQHKIGVIALGVLALALAGVIIWFVRRPRPTVKVTPEISARHALEPLRQQMEDGALLSRVSQIVRRYATEAFELGSGELTTAEFCRAIGGKESIGPELAAALCDFLRRCDERKFAPAGRGPSVALGAVPKALELIALAEARLGVLRQPSQGVPPSFDQTAAAKG